MDVLIMPLGSHGDVHPFLGIASALRARGHRVTVIASAYYDSLICAMGLNFVPLGKAEDFLAVARDPDIWHPLRGFAKVGQSVGETVPMCYRAVLEHAGKDSVLVYSTLAFGARLAQETLNLRGVSIHLSPSIFASSYDPPKMPGMLMPSWLPRWTKRAMFRFVEATVVDPIFGGPLNKFREELHLPKVKGIMSEWCHSPQRVIGLFPAWYAPPQPDWPKQAVVTGFPLFDEKDVTPLPEKVEEFLQAKSAPIVFTPGSAMMHGQNFFAAGVEACRILGRRGILLTRHSEHVPGNLPDGVIHAPYAPFSQLLPRSAALVHHGGIGSTAQAMACGVPQLMMPMGFDQPDNARRIKRLGVGDALAPKKFKGRAVAGVLGRLIGSEGVAERCKRVAERFKAEPDALGETVGWIEQIGTI
ncbi:MAG: glycosyltransferase [Tepidisphaeraceae bacterium]